MRANDLSKQHPSDPPPTYSHPLYLTPVHCVRLAHTGHRTQRYTVHSIASSFEECLLFTYELHLRSQDILHVIFVLHCGGALHLGLLLGLLLGLGLAKLYPERHGGEGGGAGGLCHCCWAHRSLLSPVSQCHHLQLCAGACGRSRLRAALGPRVALLGSARKLGGGGGAGRRLALDLEFQPFTKAHTWDK